MIINKTYRFLDSCLVFLLIMSAGSVFFQLQRNNLSYLLFFLTIFILFFTGKQLQKSIFYNSILTFLFSSLLLLLNYLIAPSIEFMDGFVRSPLQYGFHFLNLMTCILILIHFKNNRTYSYFIEVLYLILKIVLFQAIFSFLFYFLIRNNLQQLIGGWGDKYIADTYYYLFFYDPNKYQFSLFGIEFIRTQGWFWEPGILQFYLNLLLFLQGFVIKRNNTILILTIFAIILTYSTTGIFIMLLLLAIIFWSSIKRSPILIFIALLSFLPLYNIAKTNFENKTTGDRSSSFQKRYLDLVEPFSIALDYPITGIGLDRQYFQAFRPKYQMEDNFGRRIENITGFQRVAEDTDKGSSNSFTYLMAAMGIPISFFFFYCLFNQQLIIYRRYLFITIVIISLFSEPLLLRPFFLLLIVSGLSSIFSKFTT